MKADDYDRCAPHSRHGRQSLPPHLRLKCFQIGLGCADLVRCQDDVVSGISNHVTEAPTAMNMPPSLSMRTSRILAHVKELAPLLVVEHCRISGTDHMRLASIAKLNFRAISTMGTGDEEHVSAPPLPPQLRL